MDNRSAGFGEVVNTATSYFVQHSINSNKKGSSKPFNNHTETGIELDYTSDQHKDSKVE